MKHALLTILSAIVALYSSDSLAELDSVEAIELSPHNVQPVAANELVPTILTPVDAVELEPVAAKELPPPPLTKNGKPATNKTSGRPNRSTAAEHADKKAQPATPATKTVRLTEKQPAPAVLPAKRPKTSSFNPAVY